MNASIRSQTSETHSLIERALVGGPRTGKQLMELLNISQSTLSRAMRDLSATVTNFRIGRTPYYALLRALPGGINPRQRISRILSTGHIDHFAEVEFLAGGGTLEITNNDGVRLYDGLPPYMSFAAPSGFLGRQLAHSVVNRNMFPVSLKDWNDDHRVAFLFTEAVNLAGNLVFGDICLQNELNFRKYPLVEAEEKLDYYVGMAQQLRTISYGSSAGGEQPKFLWVARDSGHVIVKFARRGSRMADLLPLEHLAMRSLAEVGVPTAETELLASDQFVFLEVRRFDRVGEQGRVGMLSAGAVDDEFFGKRDTWPEFAARCVNAGYLTKQDAEHVSVMAAFSELIGNSDRHFENISMLIADDGEYQGIAPAYDILPMRYASIGGGVDPELVPIEPKVGTIGSGPRVWALASKAAERFWSAVMTEELAAPISRPMRELAERNRKVALDFAAPFLPVE